MHIEKACAAKGDNHDSREHALRTKLGNSSSAFCKHELKPERGVKKQPPRDDDVDAPAERGRADRGCDDDEGSGDDDDEAMVEALEKDMGSTLKASAMKAATAMKTMKAMARRKGV